jgi:hypothetical protein
VYVSQKVRLARWQDEVVRVDCAASASDAHFARVAHWWPILAADSRLMGMLNHHGLHDLRFDRTERSGKNGQHGGVSVLELVVLAGVVSALLAHSDVVRWLASHHADALVDLQAAADGTLSQADAERS